MTKNHTINVLKALPGTVVKITTELWAELITKDYIEKMILTGIEPHGDSNWITVKPNTIGLILPLTFEIPYEDELIYVLIEGDKKIFIYTELVELL